ncbi:MAG: hypothetical protein KIT31_41090, partial [Deltaproteobacteria bacterium]|nr:hypothetical protein [Deltaproteobacteria bacterium]
MASRSGELAMRPLPAVLLDLHEDFATGKLVLTRGRVSKTVDLVNGNPVSTASTPRDETLGHFLVHSGVITEEQHRQAVARAAELGGKLGEALVALRVLTVEQLIEQLGRQARHKLVQALRWPQGAWRFDPANEAVEGMQLRMVEVVLSGLRETAVDDLERLARLDGMAFELSGRGTRLRHELKRAFGERVVTLLADGIEVGALERELADRAGARALLDALMLCDAIEVSHAPSTKTEPSVMAPLPQPNLGRASTRPALFDILFDDIGGAADGAAPLDMDDADAGDHPRADQSGVVSTFDMSEVSDESEHVAHARQTLAAEHQRVKGADHYAALVIGRRAPAADIDAAAQVRLALVERDAAALTDPRDR